MKASIFAFQNAGLLRHLFFLNFEKFYEKEFIKALQFSSNSFNVYPEVPANEVDEETMRTT